MIHLVIHPLIVCYACFVGFVWYGLIGRADLVSDCRELRSKKTQNLQISSHLTTFLKF